MCSFNFFELNVGGRTNDKLNRLHAYLNGTIIHQIRVFSFFLASDEGGVEEIRGDNIACIVRKQ